MPHPLTPRRRHKCGRRASSHLCETRAGCHSPSSPEMVAHRHTAAAARIDNGGSGTGARSTTLLPGTGHGRDHPRTAPSHHGRDFHRPNRTPHLNTGVAIPSDASRETSTSTAPREHTSQCAKAHALSMPTPVRGPPRRELHTQPVRERATPRLTPRLSKIPHALQRHFSQRASTQRAMFHVKHPRRRNLSARGLAPHEWSREARPRPRPPPVRPSDGTS